MTRSIPAVILAAALGMGASASAFAQEPGPSAPTAVPVLDARAGITAPGRPERPTKIDVSSSAPVSAPGDAVGRAAEPPVMFDQRRGGGSRGGATRGRSGGSRGGAPVVVRRGGGWGAPRGWGGPVYVARPYYYDPFWASGAFGWSPMFYAPWSLMWSTAGYGPYPWFGSTTFNTGGLRLKMKPRDAQVFIDGAYAGVVDEFDGIFQSLRLAPGAHKLEVRMPGFEPLTMDVHIQPDRTMTVQQTLQPSNP
ncbi:MAG: PEGA domain-containing protein [Vicinamibacterales bacterium]